MTITAGVIVAIIALVGSVGTSRITADSAIKDKVADIRVDIGKNTTAISLNENHSTARLNRLETKIDWLIRNVGGNPSSIAPMATHVASSTNYEN